MFDTLFSVTVGGGDMPEHIEASFEITNLEGGNGSGPHDLTITWGGGSFEPEILSTNGCVSGVRLRAHGDWELEGMLSALIALGEHLHVYRKK